VARAWGADRMVWTLQPLHMHTDGPLIPVLGNPPRGAGMSGLRRFRVTIGGGRASASGALCWGLIPHDPSFVLDV
jgi:hypothetical protein